MRHITKKNKCVTKIIVNNLITNTRTPISDRTIMSLSKMLDTLNFCTHLWNKSLEYHCKSVKRFNIPKSFVKVWQAALILELLSYGIPPILSSASNFRFNRQFYIVVNGFSSAPYSINTGNPSIFLLFQNLFFISVITFYQVLQTVTSNVA